MAYAIAAARVADDGGTVTLVWDDGTESRFAALWLRDHCETPERLHPETLQRQSDVFALGEPVAAAAAAPVEDGRALAVSWRDGAADSRLTAALLADMARPAPAGPERTPWTGSDLADGLPRVSYGAVSRGDAGVLDWLAKVARYGFCLVDDVPETPAATRALAERVGHLRETIFGAFWDFTADLAHSDTAYTTLAIAPHTDGTYMHDAPGLQLFHVIEFDGEGGDSVLVDGLRLAEDLRREDPEAFATLCRVEVPARYIEPGVHLHSRRPVIRLDADGRVAQVSFNNHDRAPFLLEEAEMAAFYRAYGLFHRMAGEPARQVRFGLRPGTALLFDNWRTLHGRLAYAGHRRLCGAYLNREDFESRLRTLRAGDARRAA